MRLGVYLAPSTEQVMNPSVDEHELTDRKLTDPQPPRAGAPRNLFE